MEYLMVEEHPGLCFMAHSQSKAEQTFHSSLPGLSIYVGLNRRSTAEYLT